MSAILTVALPLFAIIVAGYFGARAKLMNEAQAGALNRFVFMFAMPAAVFRFASTNPPPGPEAAPFALAYLLCVFSVMTAAFLIGRKLLKLRIREAGVHALGSSLGNAVFLGLPIALSVDGWGGHYLILVLLEGVFVLAAGSALMTWPEDGGDAHPGRQILDTLKRVGRNPIAMGTLIGFLCSVVGLVPSGPPERFLFYLGGAAGPAALFSLGVTLGQPREAPEAGARASILSIVAAKLIALPALFVGALLLLGATKSQIGAAALFTCMPMGVGVYVQASHFGIYTRRTAAALTATTVLSVLTVSTVLYFLAPAG